MSNQQTSAPTSRVDSRVDSEVPPRGRKERLADGWCVYGACPRRQEGWPEPIHHHCQRHRIKVQKRQAKWVANKREELTQAGKCRRCRKPSTTYRCPACAIADRTKLGTSRVDSRVDTNDPWRRDNDGWARYRGKGRRGPPPASVNDNEDLTTAAAALERGRQALLYAHSEPVRARGKHAQVEARAAAASLLHMAARFVGEVVQRHLPPAPRVQQLRDRVRSALGDLEAEVELPDAVVDRIIAVLAA